MTSNEMFPWDEIPNTDTLEDCDAIAQGVSIEDGESQNTGKRMFKAQIQIQEPAIYHGMNLFENFVTGTDEAPKAIMAGTMGTKRLKRMFMAAQVPAASNVAVLCSQFPGTKFGVTVVKTIEKDGEYKGQERNRITSFWKIGEKTPGVKAAKGGVAPVGVAGPVAAPPPAFAAPGGMPRVPGLPGAMPTGVPTVSAPPMPPAAPFAPPPAPVAAHDPLAAAAADGWLKHPSAPGFWYKGQEVLAEAAVAAKYPAAPAAPPAPVAPPAPMAPPAAPVAAPRPAGPPAAPGLTQLCTMCNTQVPLAQLAAHVVACAAAHGVTQ